MTDTKTIIYPEGGNLGGNGVEGMLLGSAMNGGGFGGGGMWNNPIWAIVFLAALRNGGIFGNGYDNNGNCGCMTQNQLSAIQETLNTNQGNTMLMDAIKGNANAAHELASTINCNFNAVQAAINSVQSSICALGNQVGMGDAQIVNAINNGNMALANQLSQCCCDVKQSILTQGYETRIAGLQQSQMIANGFAQVGYASADQTCQLKQNANDNTGRILAKLDAIEDSRKDREISALTAQLATVNARAERQAELAPIVQQLNEIACKQPQTVTLPYSCATAVPTAMVYNGFYGAGQFGNGIFG